MVIQFNCVFSNLERGRWIQFSYWLSVVLLIEDSGCWQMNSFNERVETWNGINGLGLCWYFNVSRSFDWRRYSIRQQVKLVPLKTITWFWTEDHECLSWFDDYGLHWLSPFTGCIPIGVQLKWKVSCELPSFAAYHVYSWIHIGIQLALHWVIIGLRGRWQQNRRWRFWAYMIKYIVLLSCQTTVFVRNKTWL